MGALFRFQAQQVDAAELCHVRAHLIARLACQHRGQRALAGAIGPHDRVHLARPHLEVDAIEHLLAGNGGAQPSELQKHSVVHPIAPSRLTFRRFCASTANSIGNCLNTFLQKPLTTRFSVSSAVRPRWRQ